MQVHKRKILVVDDNVVNRRILCRILAEEYITVEKNNGQEAIQEIKQKGEDYSLVLLDLCMPIMDGYGFMECLKEENLIHPPIIVMTGNRSTEEELRSLESGASDFISKPFNVEIVRHRVKSIIRLNENSQMINLLKYDQLTQAYTKEYFYQYVRALLVDNPEGQFDIICYDVENFKMVNERYGTKMGDKLLCEMTKAPSQVGAKNDICGRLSANTFAVIVNHRDSYSEEYFSQISQLILENYPVSNIVFKYGVYGIHNVKMDVSAMCDRAVLAIHEIKHRYGTNFSVYDDRLRLKLLREQKIVESMERGLEQNQFQVYFQPKHDVNNHRIFGAEALVRWLHPEFGFMSPSEFIPLFEKNGFISRMDAFVWEETCRILGRWKQEGKPLIPISVNVSRTDFGALDLVEYFQNLSKRYQVPPEYIHLEVTETAYVDNPKKIIHTVEQLRGNGFKIEMDDFGSGYSSLNMLGELPVDYIKLDAQFMRTHKNKESSRNVLNFVILLSQWLGLPTIAEGVETEEEVSLLRTMGCKYVQGYYFARPMPLDDFEAYIQNEEVQEVPAVSEVLKSSGNNGE